VNDEKDKYTVTLTMFLALSVTDFNDENNYNDEKDCDYLNTVTDVENPRIEVGVC
jgi:hypothetical protein